MGERYLANLSRYIPELLACLTMFSLLLIEAGYGRSDKKKPLFWGAAALGLGLTLIATCMQSSAEPTLIFTNSIVVDHFSQFLKMVMILGTAGAIYLSSQSSDIVSGVKSEYAALVVGVLVGGMLLVSANNMLIFYIGIETLSILSYVLASFKKDDERSSEAGLKYSLYGGISAGIMLFGMSHIFGVLGTIHFNEMATAMSSLSTSQVYILVPSFLLFFVGLGYKISCVPFHMWTPDVYEGSPIPVTAFFSIVPKVAGVGALVRISLLFFGDEGSVLGITWVGLLCVIGALTMTVGNIAAINQRSIKRMLAYSSISHAGVMIVGVVAMSEAGVNSILFYTFTYLFMTLGAFYIVSMVNDKYGNDHFERFNGLIFRYPFMGLALCAIMFSLAGIPPFSGFVAKFNILSAIIDQKHYTLAVILGVNSVISLYYYLKIVRFMVFKPVESTETIGGFGFVNQTIIVAITIPVIVLGIWWSGLASMTGGAKIFP